MSSSKDVLSQNFRSTKTKEVTGVNSPQIYFKAVVRRELAGAEGGDNASLVDGVTSVRAHPSANSFSRLRRL